MSMSLADMYGMMLGTTNGSHSWSKSAALLLRSPDQLINTFIHKTPPVVADE
jgi:hypothetical protein